MKLFILLLMLSLAAFGCWKHSPWMRPLVRTVVREYLAVVLVIVFLLLGALVCAFSTTSVHLL